MPKFRIVIEGEHEPGEIPKMQITAPDLNGPDLLFHLRNVCDIIQSQVIAATVRRELGVPQPGRPGNIVIPGLVPPKDLRG